MASFCCVLMMLLPVKIDLVVVFAVWGSQLAIDVLALICSALHTLLSTLCCRHYLDTSLLRCSTRPAPRICFFTCLLTCRKSNFRVILSLTASSARPLAGLGEHEQIEEVGTELGGWVARVEVVGDHGR